jgi:hypothetical protein
VIGKNVRGRGKRRKTSIWFGEKLAKVPRSHRSSIRSMVSEGRVFMGSGFLFLG